MATTVTPTKPDKQTKPYERLRVLWSAMFSRNIPTALHFQPGPEWTFTNIPLDAVMYIAPKIGYQVHRVRFSDALWASILADFPQLEGLCFFSSLELLMAFNRSVKQKLDIRFEWQDATLVSLFGEGELADRTVVGGRFTDADLYRTTYGQFRSQPPEGAEKLLLFKHDDTEHLRIEPFQSLRTWLEHSVDPVGLKAKIPFNMPLAEGGNFPTLRTLYKAKMEFQLYLHHWREGNAYRTAFQLTSPDLEVFSLQPAAVWFAC